MKSSLDKAVLTILCGYVLKKSDQKVVCYVCPLGDIFHFFPSSVG